MSEHSICNHCTYESIKRRKPAGRRLIERREHGWLSIYSVPDGTSDAEFEKLTSRKRDEMFLASFMAITDRCAC